MNLVSPRISALFLVLASFCVAAGVNELPPAEQNAIDQISSDSLKTNLTYIASDELAGRGTPSRGLDLAADYIADQFRRAGLEPLGSDGSYFQIAKFDEVTPNKDGFELSFKAGDRQLVVNVDHVRVRSLAAIDLAGASVLGLPGNGAIPAIAGRIVAGDEEHYGTEAGLAELQARKPALILLFGKTRPMRGDGKFLEEADSTDAPVIRIHDSDVAAVLRERHEVIASVHVAAPDLKVALLRNVAGVLRGSDSTLRDRYLILTAHYDHLGTTPKGIFHGANDNGSGTVSVIEIGRTLAGLNPRPKRSIVFMTFFGEEEGLLGSYYYAAHPLVPLKNTVADINLEQMGRTDEKTGKEVGAVAFTGFGFSSLPSIMSAAAKAEGIKTYSVPDADDYFSRSDNYAFALHGVIAHTLAVAFEYPDYHALGDTVDKIDFDNMAKVDRGVAAGLLRLADEPDAPKWSDNKSAGVYREARRD